MFNICQRGNVIQRWQKLIRCYSYYITTPVFYVNSSPHIGHVHTILLADALNIYHRIKLNDSETIFSTGTDEHGIKVQTAAEASDTSCKQFCEKNSKKFRDLFNSYDTTLTDFVRTSEDRHEKAVSAVWSSLKSRGFIYKNSYSGWYSSSEECFVPESQIIKKQTNGETIHLDQNENSVIWLSEENYMFRLSEFNDRILDWIISQKPVLPDKFNNEVVNMLKQTHKNDISISRPFNRLSWGIKVPDDPTQVVYVWLDALTNYLTVVNYPNQQEELKRWPIDCQVIGKDILKFHAIYWPAFLMALSLPLPKQIICHSHWMIDSYKMSKSRGNVVDPHSESSLLTSEGLRYYLLRASTPHSDTDYSQTQAFRRINAELADTYGNLVSRCCAPAINPKQIIPDCFVEPINLPILELKEQVNNLKKFCFINYEAANFYKAIDEIMTVLRQNNALYEKTKPWKLVKLIETDEEAFKEYWNLQAITFEVLRICSILLQPIIPKLSNSALDRLNVTSRSFSDAHVKLDIGDPHHSHRDVAHNSSSILFQRLKNSEKS